MSLQAFFGAWAGVTSGWHPGLPKKPVSILGILIVCAALVTARGNADEASSPSAASSLQQKPGDLLAGFSRGVCYSGFRQGQHPDRGDGAVNPTDAEILEDLRILSDDGHFGLIRLYDAQENSATVLRLIESHKLDLKVLLGAWLSAEVSNPNCPWMTNPYPAELLEQHKRQNAAEIDRAIRLANQYSNTVVAVAVGNEALVDWTDHKVPVESVVNYVRRVKRSISQPVTVADNYDWWAKHGANLASKLDFVSVHVYPVWEGKDIDQGLPYSISNLEAVRKTLPGSRLVITEAGWATVASEFGPRASEANQQRYFRELFDWARQMNITTFFFEAFDESWKGDPNNPLGAEKHWGLYREDRKPKLVMENFVF